MAIAATRTTTSSSSTMSHDDSNKADHDHDHDEHVDEHEHDMVMPGFRFHPTEEELVEFYLRRKVEGKRFNVELITFLDLYRYDPWELPGIYTHTPHTQIDPNNHLDSPYTKLYIYVKFNSPSLR